ncbi:MAG: phosphoglycerate kinase [Myxococcota bacterium]
MAVLDLDSLLAKDVRGRRIFVRADLNAPLRDGVVADDTRLRASAGTLRRLAEAGARVVVASHLGRPGGARNPAFSLDPIALALEGILQRPVTFLDGALGQDTQQAIEALPEGGIALLENLRFEAGEEANDEALGRTLASLADVYVNDAFGTAHRAHASTAGMTQHFEKVYAGDLLRRELDELASVKLPERPLLCLLGGAKVSDKLSVLEALAPHADTLAVGGAMAYTFLAADGLPTGNSLVESGRIEDARCVRAAAEAAGRNLLLPVDHVVVKEIAADAESRVVETIPDGWIGVDIGPRSAALYAEAAAAARTIFWNGPMGIFEIEPFAAGTRTVAQAVGASEGRLIVGGGDSLAAVNQLGLAGSIDHLSTGGGASLEYVQGKRLPGLEALER